MSVVIKGETNVGNVRTNNEDKYIAENIWNKNNYLAVVIDGVGGYEGGEVAADIAENSIRNYLLKYRNGERGTLIREAVIEANNNIFNEQLKDPRYNNMSCVLTACIVDMDKGELYMAHVGDTRLFLYLDGKLTKLSHDHSLVGYREEIGDISEEEAMQHPQRNVINRVLGTELLKADNEDFIECATFNIGSGSTYLLCSDGLTDILTSGEIIKVLGDNNSISEKCDILINNANKAGGPDNITVVLFETHINARSVVSGKVNTNDKSISSSNEPEKNTLSQTAPVTSEQPKTELKTTPSKYFSTGNLIASITGLVIGGLLTLGIFWKLKLYPAKMTPISTPVQHSATDSVNISLFDKLSLSEINEKDSFHLNVHIHGTDTTIYIDRPVYIYIDSLNWIQEKPIFFQPADSLKKTIGLIILGRKCKIINVAFRKFTIDTLSSKKPIKNSTPRK